MLSFAAIDRWLSDQLGIGTVMIGGLLALILAYAVRFLAVAYGPVEAAFERIRPRILEAARTLGRSEWAIAILVTLPLAWRGILAGVALTFARAVGEFGATVMVAGNLPGRTLTGSVAIYDAVQAGRMGEANLLALLLTLTTAGALYALTRVGRTGP
jgi:molybdate transport system permease protein